MLHNDPASADEEVARLRLDLRNIDLATLVDRGFLTYDHDEDLVRKGPQFDAITPQSNLPENDEQDDPQPTGLNERFDRPLNHVFKLLANHHRRHALTYLVGMDDDTATLDELSGYVAARHANSGNNPGHDDELARGLHHIHLPKLEAAGVIEYDARSETIRYHGQLLLEQALVIAEQLGHG